MSRSFFPFLCGMLGLFAACLCGPCSEALAQGYLLHRIHTDLSARRHQIMGRRFQLRSHRVKVLIEDQVAHTTLTQVYQNPTIYPLEASYLFVLPPGAVVSSFSMMLDGKRVRGKLLQREKAARIYRRIVARMKDPGLLEYVGRRLLRVKLFPIPPKGTQRIMIKYTQVVPRFSGMYRYHYPLRSLQQRLRTTKDFTFVVQMKSRRSLKTIYSPTHKVSISRKGGRQALVGFEQVRASLHRDVVLYYSVAKGDVGLSLLAHRTSAGKGFFMLSLSPTAAQKAQRAQPKDVTFVIDTSGSMLEEKRMKWAQRALISCLGKLHPSDRFNIISFATDVESLYRQPLAATPQRIKRAQQYTKELVATGGTALEPALRKALRQPTRQHTRHLVIMLTDGEPTVGKVTSHAILRSLRLGNKRKARIFTFGIGHDINTKLLDQIASQSRGVGDYVAPNREIKERMSWFYDKIRYPALRDVTLRAKGPVRLVGRYPKQLPDLYRGEQVLLFGRYRGSGKVQLELSGWMGRKKVKLRFAATFPKQQTQHSFIRQIWARRKVAYLLDAIRFNGMNKELKRSIIKLSQTYDIVTPWTSSLVTAPAKVTKPPTASGKTRASQRHRRPARVKARQWSSQSASRSYGGWGASSSVMRRVRRYAWQLRRVYERSLKSNPNIGGKISLRLTITKNGRVHKVETTTNQLGHNFARELRRAVRRWRFPKQQKGPVTFDIPLVFQSNGDWSRLRAKTGRRAVEQSKWLRRLKATQHLTSQERTRWVKGRRFVSKMTDAGTCWIEAPIRARKVKAVVHVHFGSKLYFALLHKAPDNKTYLALGTCVHLLRNGTMIRVQQAHTQRETPARLFWKRVTP